MAAGSTYTPLYTTTLGSAQASVTFSSFSGYTDLVLVFNGGATGTADFHIQVNSDAAGNYSRTWLTGNGSVGDSSRASSVGYMRFDQNGYLGTSLTNNIIINIMNYSNSTTYKTLLSRSNTAATGTDAIVNLWRSTSAITTIYCYADGTTFLSGSTFTLYGIAAA